MMTMRVRRTSAAPTSAKQKADQRRERRTSPDRPSSAAGEARVPVDDVHSEEDEDHRAGREERPERDVLLAAPLAHHDERAPDEGAQQEPCEQSAEDVAPTEPAEEQPQEEREPDVAEAD